ncbi:MAG TPA: hypothetical protein VIB39_11200 [Candidatus Angelobacter sp.]|jgi:hypothetical protein
MSDNKPRTTFSSQSFSGEIPEDAILALVVAVSALIKVAAVITNENGSSWFLNHLIAEASSSQLSEHAKQLLFAMAQAGELTIKNIAD